MNGPQVIMIILITLIVAVASMSALRKATSLGDLLFMDVVIFTPTSLFIWLLWWGGFWG